MARVVHNYDVRRNLCRNLKNEKTAYYILILIVAFILAFIPKLYESTQLTCSMVTVMLGAVLFRIEQRECSQ